MRKLFVVSFFLLPVIYFYGLQATDSETQAGAQSQTSADEIRSTAIELSRKLVTNDAAAPEAVVLEKPQVAAKPTPKLRRKAPKKAQASLQKAPALKAASDDSVAKNKSINPKKTPIKDRNFGNPKDDRWLKDNSELARFGMAKKSNDIGCSNEIEDCAKRRKDQNISIVGVVVQTDRLVSTPTDSLDGEVKQGNYNDYLPGLYVK